MLHGSRESELASHSFTFLTVALVLTLTILGWFAWTTWVDFRVRENNARRDLQFEDLRSQIVYLDEVLTMSACMAVETGDAQWEERFRTHEPILAEAIRRAIDLAPSDLEARAAQETAAANQSLLQMEHKALAFMRGGQQGAARDLLMSAEYDSWKRSYYQNMIRFTTSRSPLIRLQQLRGTILHLDEVLTMSAHMATQTGNPKWRQRYVENEELLLAAINEAVENAPGLESGAAAEETDAANAALVQMEQESFALVDAGQLSDAQALLNNPDYRQQKEIYRSAMERFDEHLEFVTIEANRANTRRAGFKVAATCFTVIALGVIWIWILVLTRRRQAALALSNEMLAAQSGRLELARAEAEAATLSKSAFLANMSHETRTPMTAILGYSKLLRDRGDLSLAPSHRVDAIETIQRNGDHLLHLINDILDMSKIEAGKLVVEQVACSPHQILGEVEQLLKGRIEEAGLDFTIEYTNPVPEHIETDPTRLRQILLNLIGNAVKFTERGTIQLLVRSIETAGRAQLQFDLIDSGIGMTADQAAQLFHPFAQADPTMTRRFGGTGLGLTISKRLAEMLGGDVAIIQSELGAGSHFCITIDAGDVMHARLITGARDLEHALKLEASGENESSALANYRILLAEDGPDNRRLIAFYLQRAGATVVTEQNGKLALDTALAAEATGNGFDVILMDMQMPVMDGYEATVELRSAGCGVPIIALTAHAMDGDREKCVEAGCDDYATKPIDHVELIRLVRCYEGRLAA